MAVRSILLYGDPRLEAANETVVDFGADLDQLVADLFETGRRAPGLGLAAPQVGVNLRVATIDVSVGKDFAAKRVLVNPTILWSEGSVTMEEGCLSFPGLYTTIARPRRLRVRAQDAAGAWWEETADDLLAQAVCHELDHLAGTLIVHHLRGLKRQMFLRRVARARKLGVWPQSS
jgi:peptide deformylase